MDSLARDTSAEPQAEQLAREQMEKLAQTKAEWLRKRAALASKDAAASPSETTQKHAPADAPQTPETKLQKLQRTKLAWLHKQKLTAAVTASSDAAEVASDVPAAGGTDVTSEVRTAAAAAEETADDVSSEERVPSSAAGTPKSGKRQKDRARWTPERKLEAAEERVSDAVAEAKLGSPVAIEKWKKLDEAAKAKARKVEDAKAKKLDEAATFGQSGSTSPARDEPHRPEGQQESSSSGNLRQSEKGTKAPPQPQRNAVTQGKGAKIPEWRAKAAKNLAAHASGGRNVPLEADPTRNSVAQLNKLNRELTTALARWEGAVGGRALRGLHRLQGGEENKWAFVDESDIADFHQRVPEMAMQFPFELDPFQKRAIFHVEQRNNVFVAAHTSAGKTVVAEYAIALAAELGSKVFYTSPIKTLSNQKLRDFRGKFDDVGLVTGDVSINEDAQCVIMTTEILRSMLYRGADVIRDLMFVVFDEVQFLNDEERGVVWEESIIMLPPHVGIIMLSATVPNALEFASWVGKTKERKVAVVSTLKRPIPLQHSWLHRKTGAPDELTEAVLLKEGGSFLQENYRAALRANTTKDGGGSKEKGSRNKKPRQRKRERKVTENQISNDPTAQGCESAQEAAKNKGSGEMGVSQHDPVAGTNMVVTGDNDKSIDLTVEDGELKPREEAEQSEQKAATDSRKPVPKGSNKNKGQLAKNALGSVGGGGGMGPNQRHSPWTPLVRFLNEANRTPSVVFCFSKKKCEKAVESLEHSDLLPNASDKAYVHRFFEESIVKLREEDRSLPQVQRVRVNLKRGISSHHAGLLPLIKEITEILFSKGLVKVLFATETFALGVNMPARTVVFSGVRKHDGRNFRFLQAGEYVQMSGRAGRRGLDNVGHVYLFVTPDERFPEERQLRKVMTGKPISLESAFRLTYNMILNVLRVDELRVEEMMKQSFSEAGEDMKAENIASVLDKAGNTLSRITTSESSGGPVSRRDMLESGDESTLRSYAQKFCELSEASGKLTFREVNPVFERAVVPGRLIIAEVQPGLLSLAVVYSIVRQNSEQVPKVRQDTQIWVAAVTGVVESHLRRHPSSVLFLPEPRQNRRAPRVQSYHPHLWTSDGLVVSLREIHASKIVYICDECDTLLSSSRADDQERAARRWFFARKRLQEERRGCVAESWSMATKTLHANAAYLQQVMSRWGYNSRKNNVGPVESFPAEYVVSRGDQGSKQSRGPNRVKGSQPSYDARRKLCLKLVTDIELGKAFAEGAGHDPRSKIERLVLEEKIHMKMIALKTVSDTGSQPSLLPEYLKRTEVLQKLDYVDTDGSGVKMKGRCACEVSTADSVVLTEIILENILDGLEAAEICSLLSSLVCRKKNASGVHDNDAKTYSEKYCLTKAKMRSIVEHVGKVQEKCGVELDFDIADAGDDYESAICRWDLSHAVYAWAKGEPFFSITDLTEQQEGDIVVCVKRLIELLRDAQHVAKGIGNDDLLAVLEEAVVCIRRDVIFNGSLYYEGATRDADEVTEE